MASGDIYVLNTYRERIGIIDNYTSLICDKKYNDIGECELYLAATPEAFNMLRIGYYLERSDDDMVCRIQKIEVTTDVENGNFLIVSGVDVKSFLDQRVMYTTYTCKGSVFNHLNKIVKDNFIDGIGGVISGTYDVYREIPFLSVDTPDTAVTKKKMREQVSYNNIGEYFREICNRFGWGYKVYRSGTDFNLLVYAGEDRSETVVFSPQFENIITTDYSDDIRELKNCALIGGVGEGKKRNLSQAGERTASGVDRYEIFSDERNFPITVDYEDLIEVFPLTSAGGSAYIEKEYPSSATYNYFVRSDDMLFSVPDTYTKLVIQQAFPEGHEYTDSDGNEYWESTEEGMLLASTGKTAYSGTAPAEADCNYTFTPAVYKYLLSLEVQNELAEKKEEISFTGAVDPFTTFVYKEDYYLGDIVTVKNDFGISVPARISEIIEVWDDSGYSLEPKFEYLGG